jgi:hypothetical protein
MSLRLPRLALFLAGLFFGGGLDHVIFFAMDSPISHYGFEVGTSAQLGFAGMDFGVSGALCLFHARWSRQRDRVR